jgi:hypothetical protein
LHGGKWYDTKVNAGRFDAAVGGEGGGKAPNCEQHQAAEALVQVLDECTAAQVRWTKEFTWGVRALLEV